MQSFYFTSCRSVLPLLVAWAIYTCVMVMLTAKVHSQTMAGAVADFFAPLNPSSLADLRSDPRFPDHPTTKSILLSGLEAEMNQGDYYGQHLYGHIVPPETGDYVFFAASSGQSEFYLSQSDSKADLSASPICKVTSSTDLRQYDKYPSQASAPIFLVAGNYYYFEAVHQQTTGTDHLAVTWRKPGDIADPPVGAEPVPAENLVILLDPSATTLRITQSPANLTVMAYHPATFTVVAEGDSDIGPLLTYQWYRGDSAIDGATNSSFTLKPALLSDDGTKFKVMVSNLSSNLLSSSAILTVTPDTEPPAIVKVRVGLDPLTRGDAVILSFSEAIDPDSALDLANNYQFSPDWAVEIVSVDNETNVILSGSVLPLNQTYELSVSGIKDLSQNSMLAEPCLVTLNSFVSISGKVVLEDYLEIPGTALSDLTQSAKYRSGLPDRLRLISHSEAPVDQAVNYGQKMAGLLVPNLSGDYSLVLASSGNSELYLSTDDRAVNLNPNPIANASSDARQASLPQTLTAGNQYYFEAIMKQGPAGAVGNTFSLGWSLPGETNFNIIASANLATRADINGAFISFIQTPVDVQVIEYRAGVFRVAAQGGSAYDTGLFYQWTRNGTDIAGATNDAYTTPIATLANHNDRYQCRLMLPDILTNTSPEAFLTVIQDTQPPLTVSAGSLSNTIGIRFDEIMNTQGGAFTVNNGAAVNLIRWINDRSVVLFLDRLVTGVVVVNYVVQDRAGNPAQGTITAAFNNLLATGIGGKEGDGAGEIFAFGAGEFAVQAGGSGIGGEVDHCQFVYRPIAGDFDIQVRVKALEPTSRLAKAGLMLRETLDAGSRNLHVVVTPAGVETQQGDIGKNDYECQYRAAAHLNTEEWKGGVKYNQDVPYPNAWLRLQRQGAWFTAFRSWDGRAWLQISKASNACPSTMWVGLCVTAGNNDPNGFTRAEFVDFNDTALKDSWINRCLESGLIITARGENPSHGQTPSQASDESTATKWLDFSASSWLQFQFSRPGGWAVAQYGIASGDDAPERDPKNWTLSGSTNGYSWVVLDSRLNQAAWTERQTWKFFEVHGSHAFNYYRLDITNHAGDICQLSEVGLFEVELTEIPELAIAKGLGSVVISWPDTLGFLLTQSPRLGSSAAWGFAGTGDVTNGIRSVTVKPVGTGMFYRLQK